MDEILDLQAGEIDTILFTASKAVLFSSKSFDCNEFKKHGIAPAFNHSNKVGSVTT
jgi:hypothetical protein